MYKITDAQIDFILGDIRARGVEMEDLQFNLLDHICCIIEQNLGENEDFGSFYEKTISTFYKDYLWEIEEETLNLLIFKNYYTMKKIMIVSGVFSAASMSLGILCKFMHWPGAVILIILGILCCSFVFLPLLFTLKAKEQQQTKNKLTAGVAILGGILVSFSVLFKIQHWPGANLLGVLFLVWMLAVYLPLYFFTGIRNPETKVNTIVTSLLIIMGGGLFLTLVNTRPKLQEQSALISNKYLQGSYEAISRQSETILHADDSIAKNIGELRRKSNALCNSIEQLKLELVNTTEGSNINQLDYDALGKLDNYDKPTQFLFGSDVEPETKLAQLKQELVSLNAFCSQTFKVNSSAILDVDDKTLPETGTTVSWEQSQFYHTPLIYVLRNLTQLQLNIRFVEASCAA